MKILKLIINDFQQFKHLELDFTHPETGEPLDKICFIGRNATGKSTLLEILANFLKNINEFTPYSFHIFKLQLKKQTIYSVHGNKKIMFLKQEIDRIPDWQSKLVDINSFLLDYNNFIVYTGLEDLEFDFDSDGLIIFAPSESSKNNLLELSDVPNTFLELAKNTFSSFDWFYTITNENIDKFWELLLYYLDKRKENYLNYLKMPDNQFKTVQQTEKDFELQFPNILKRLASFWDKMLLNSNLYFDYQNAEITDNLKAYIKIKGESSLDDIVIPYNKLSTGIRNFIFKIGHIYSLYFNRKIERGFLLVDEPENSLFPDFLYDLIDGVYSKIIENQNTQFFVSTHNPIIAAQFEPYERIILDFDDDGYVFAKKGTVPVGDDPNDILFKDFGMRSIYTKKGLEKWERYLELKVLIKHTPDETERNRLIEEFSKLGREYNFPSK